MTPEFNHSNILPPFVGERLFAADSSPYVMSSSELVDKMGHTSARRYLLRSFLSYRTELRKFGFQGGFQWVNGSFTENIEAEQNRPPQDIDLVTFTYPASGLSSRLINEKMKAHPDLFDRDRCKATYLCDTFLVNLDKRADLLVQDVRYWYGMFSHRRADHLWKGFLQVPLNSDDDNALALLSLNDDEGVGGHAPT